MFDFICMGFTSESFKMKNACPYLDSNEQTSDYHLLGYKRVYALSLVPATVASYLFYRSKTTPFDIYIPRLTLLW